MRLSAKAKTAAKNKLYTYKNQVITLSDRLSFNFGYLLI